jgi:hypothetical protein
MDTLNLNELKEQKKNQSKINKKQYKEDYNAKLVECECGLMCRYSNLFRHYKSYRHVTYLENK